MASKINADEFVDREGEGKPTLPKGVVLSGVTTITTAVVAENEVANSTGINVGIITSTHFAGNLTGDVNAGIVTVTSQTVVGSAVTISASGIDIGAGVMTATSYAGSGANLTGLGATIMIWEYNPDPYDTAVTLDTGIGITFNQRIKAGSGNITLRIAGAAGTVVENFGVGSSVTINNNSLSMTPTSNLESDTVYHLNYPSGVITNMAGDNYVGTAYTFTALTLVPKLFVWGNNNDTGTNARGQLGLNQGNLRLSSPVQLPGSTWNQLQGNYVEGYTTYMMSSTKTDGTLWVWGDNQYGVLATNQAHNATRYSSPVQVPGTTWSFVDVGENNALASKTDGTLWSWGYGSNGSIGNSTSNNYSSPVQVGSGTDWDTTAGRISSGNRSSFAIKTDGTLYSWGNGHLGNLGQNLSGPGFTAYVSSPVQVPGTTWNGINAGFYWTVATKTDGTLWAWGQGGEGQLGQNSTTSPSDHGISSPIQIPGTTWKTGYGDWAKSIYSVAAIKTDGTLWSWGQGGNGALGLNDANNRSSPTQVGSDTTWNKITAGNLYYIATKTDGTLWSWGSNVRGQLGQNDTANRSSPIQIGSRTDWTSTELSAVNWSVYAMLKEASG